ncbi:ORF V: Enzymatic polyprotein [Labeo rohita]|uniref:ORF V: Enzymatic polyprotein n=1 Tax=Labeo rohita TaxID=84645 RepID=A0ABQ8MBS8_LABRO|nr:ORF V: Enzymatic polyprotein [Labeo rohita]
MRHPGSPVEPVSLLGGSGLNELHSRVFLGCRNICCAVCCTFSHSTISCPFINPSIPPCPESSQPKSISYVPRLMDTPATPTPTFRLRPSSSDSQVCACFNSGKCFSHGFHPGVESLPSQSLICPNLQSALAEPETVDSPIGVATRKFLGKKRLIIDLSSPHNSQFPSINSLILLEEFSLHYHDIDQAITLIKDADYVPAARLLTTQKLFSELGIPLAQDKTEGPRTSIKFLGINLEKFLASLPKEKIDRTVLVASTLLTNSSCSKRELLFILGHLNFVIRIIPQGRPFISHLLSLASSADALEDHISLTDSNSSCVYKRFGEHLQRKHALNHMCNQSNREAGHHRRVLFKEGAFTSVPRGSGPASAEAERQLHSWGSQLDLLEGMETGEPLSPSSPGGSGAHSQGSEARSAATSPPSRISSSEEVESECVEVAPQSPQYEELLASDASDGYVSHRLGGPHLTWHINCLEMLAVFRALNNFLPDLIGRHVLVRTDNTAVVYYINHQGGLHSCPLYKLAHQILVWSQDKLLSLRAVHVSGHLNMGADILSRQGQRLREWMLHPEVVKQIWRVFGQAQVDLFVTQENVQCPHWFSQTHPAPLGLDAMVQTWPSLRLYAFPPIILLPGVLERVRRDGVRLLLVAPYWPARAWFSDLISLLDGSPWEIPVRRDLLSQAGGTILHPRPELWKLWSSLHEETVCPEVAWCEHCQQDPVNCPVGTVLEFLQDRFSAGLAHSTLRVYVAAISAHHTPLGGMSVCKDPLVVRFLRGALRLRPPVRPRVPTWDLVVVLEALCGPPFEPIEESSDHHLSVKTVLLLALTSLKRVGDLQALSVAPSHLKFALAWLKLFFTPDRGMSRRSPLQHHGLSHSRPSVLLPFGIRTSRSLIVCVQFEHWTHTSTELPCGENLTNCLSAYEFLDLLSPLGVKAHSTRGISASKAFMSGVPMQDICDAAGWSTPLTFVRFYDLDLRVAPGSSVLPECRLQRTCFKASWSVTSPAYDVLLLYWTDYTCDSERVYAEGVPQSVCRRSASFPSGNRGYSHNLRRSLPHGPPQLADLPQQLSSSVLFKLYPLVAAASLWGKEWSATSIIVHCDNEATVHCINKEIKTAGIRGRPAPNPSSSLFRTDIPVNHPLRHLLEASIDSILNLRKSQSKLPSHPLFTDDFNRPATRFWFQKHLKSVLLLSGTPADIFSSHSFRIGAATTEAQKGLSQQQIQALGRWSSEAFKSYIQSDRSLIKEAHRTLHPTPVGASHLLRRTAAAAPAAAGAPSLSPCCRSSVCSRRSLIHSAPMPQHFCSRKSLFLYSTAAVPAGAPPVFSPMPPGECPGLGDDYRALSRTAR